MAPARTMGPTDTEKEFLGWVSTESERVQAYMYPFHRQWYINIASAIGAQSVQAETLGRLLRIKVKKIGRAHV